MLPRLNGRRGPSEIETFVRVFGHSAIFVGLRIMAY